MGELLDHSDVRPATCVDSSGDWIIERPAFELPFGAQILPAADFNRTFFTAGDIVSGGKYSNIQGFNDGPVYDMPMIDDSTSYYLDCVDQPSRPGSLLSISDTSACPTATPTRSGGFETSWKRPASDHTAHPVIRLAPDPRWSDPAPAFT